MAAPASEVNAALRGIQALAERDLTALWGAVDLSKPEQVRNTYLRVTPAIVDQYGSAAGAVAADWYDELRAEQTVRSRYRATVTQVVEPEWVEERVRFGASSLWEPEQEQFLNFTKAATVGYIAAWFGAIIARNTNADPAAVGWERVLNPGACRFCVLLAGRGGVYKKSTVRFAAHSGCRCSARPSWDLAADEVPVIAYQASARTSRMSAKQREIHNDRIREWMDANL